jgi:hypothetical protein
MDGAIEGTYTVVRAECEETFRVRRAAELEVVSDQSRI